MKRRAFLGLLAAAAPAMAFDPDFLLWVPGAKKILLPSPRVGNTLLTSEMITREALKILEDNLKIQATINRQYSDQFEILGATTRTPWVYVPAPRRRKQA